MKRLPDEVWLAACKRLGVGSQSRIYHRQGCSSAANRPNLTLKHLPDRYVAYCQACKCAAVSVKEHVAYGYVAPAVSNLLTRPTDGVAVNALPAHEQAAVADFLASKHMDLTYFENVVVAFSASRKRLLVTDHLGQMMGRDTSGHAVSKWLTYDGQHFIEPPAWEQGSPALMVEDTFSMLKVRWALRNFPIPVAVYCSLGTKMHSSLFLKMIERHREVASFYDGDDAGWLGHNANRLELNSMGLACGALTDYRYESGMHWGVPVCAPLGHDPKDMTCTEIYKHIYRMYSHLLQRRIS